MLLCSGERDGVMHAATLPRVDGDGGVTSTDLRCVECNSPMALVDVLTVDPRPTLDSITGRYNRTGPLYTTAKLNALALLSAART